MLNLILNILQIVFAVLLISTILLQQRGTGLGSAFGGEGNVFASRRGVEKLLFRATIAPAIGFLAIAVANLLFS